MHFVVCDDDDNDDTDQGLSQVGRFFVSQSQLSSKYVRVVNSFKFSSNSSSLTVKKLKTNSLIKN